MVATVDLSDEELADLKALTDQSDASDVIRVAMKDYIRYVRRKQLKELSGKVEMMNNSADGLSP